MTKISFKIFFVFFFTICTNSFYAHADNFQNQKNAMHCILTINDCIKHTDYRRAIENLSNLKQINLEEVSSPLSLLYELVSGLKDGREDFLTLGFKYIIFKEIKRLAQRVFRTCIVTKKFVSENTKMNTLKRLKIIKNNLDATKEPCLSIINNINYILAVVEKLPENVSYLSEKLQLISSVLYLIIYKDSDSFFSVVKQINKIYKDIYLSDMLTQLTYLEALFTSLITSEDIVYFEKIMKLYNKTKFTEVKYEVLKIFGKITRMYYCDETVKKRIFENIAFKSFNKLIETINGKVNSFFFIKSEWWLKSGACEELIFLINHLEDKNAKKTVNRYLLDLKKTYEKHKTRKNLKKIISKIRNYSSYDFILCVLNNRKELYNLKLLTESLKNYKLTERKKNSKSIVLLNKSINNLKEILAEIE